MTVKRHLPALLAPFPAALLTAAIAGDAPFWAALVLFAALSMVTLAVFSAIVGVRNEQNIPRHSAREISAIR